MYLLAKSIFNSSKVLSFMLYLLTAINNSFSKF